MTCYCIGQQQNHNINSNALTGTGGGGASHATEGKDGDDRFNVSGAYGTPGKCVQWGIPNSSLIGIRGSPGPTYGDREVFTVLMGGSGGGSGGGHHGWYNAAGGIASGGGGGGGGGFLEIIAADRIIVNGMQRVRPGLPVAPHEVEMPTGPVTPGAPGDSAVTQSSAPPNGAEHP